MFPELIPLLGRRFHVVAPDYLGFGYSDAPQRPTFNTPLTTLPRR
jgi:pimeloyl-ACP methyl ester carboxylesterase